MDRYRGLLGLIFILAVAWGMSTHKKAIKTRILFWGLGLQFVFAELVLNTPVGGLFKVASDFVAALLHYSEAGASFVFGPLGSATMPQNLGVVFAFQVLPIIIFIASLFSILYYLGIMQWVVKGMAIAM